MNQYRYTLLNKSFITNLLTVLIAILGIVLHNSYLKSIGYYALSGAVTNWLAIFMLFEKIPFLYGSGVIPNRFQEFKLGIKNLIMNQFFTNDNINRFFKESDITESVSVDLQPLIASFDFEQIFQALIDAIMESKFGAMLSMMGGQEALLPLKEPIISKLKSVILEVAHGDKFKQAVATEISQVDTDNIREKVAQIVERRLDELTPQMVKVIIQDMIRKHLGWLVVWGGVLGGLIGLVVNIGQF